MGCVSARLLPLSLTLPLWKAQSSRRWRQGSLYRCQKMCARLSHQKRQTDLWQQEAQKNSIRSEYSRTNLHCMPTRSAQKSAHIPARALAKPAHAVWLKWRWLEQLQLKVWAVRHCLVKKRQAAAAVWLARKNSGARWWCSMKKPEGKTSADSAKFAWKCSARWAMLRITCELTTPWNPLPAPIAPKLSPSRVIAIVTRKGAFVRSMQIQHQQPVLLIRSPPHLHLNEQLRIIYNLIDWDRLTVEMHYWHDRNHKLNHSKKSKSNQSSKRLN